MHEVELVARLDPFQHRVGLNDLHLVPSHVRNLSQWIVEAEPLHLTWNQAKSYLVVLFGAIQRYLQAETDAEHGRAIGKRMFQSLVKLSLAQCAHGAARCTYTGKDDAFGVRHCRAVSGDAGIEPHLRTCALHAAKIAGVVVDDDVHGG